MGNLTALLSKIRPAVDDEEQTKENRTSKNADFVENVAAINVKRTVRAIQERSTILEQMIQSGEIGIVGGMHDLATGQVTYYDETSSIAS
jgi:carbonic anhydrase